MTTQETKLALDRRAAALSKIGADRHLIIGKLAMLPTSSNILLPTDKHGRRQVVQEALALINERFARTKGLPLEHWLSFEEEE